MLRVDLIPSLSDNYIFLLIDAASNKCAVVDPAEAKPVLKKMQELGLTLESIFNTHHHFDHVGGNLDLKQETNCRVYGYGPDAERLPGVDHLLNEGDSVALGESRGRVLFAPGHTLGHILYHFEGSKKCFVGDTLFSIGCGRLFEGTSEQMWSSLQIFLDMPDETEIYCAHEYTLSNCRFTEILVGDDRDFLNYKDHCLEKLAKGQPTIPTTLFVEKQFNPFLAISRESFRQRIGLGHLSALEAFTELRKRKDSF